MTVVERLRGLVALLPEGAAVTLPVAELRSWIAEDDGDAPASAPVPPGGAETDRWLTAEETRARLNVSVRWCYDHAKEIGGRRLSRRCVRFSERAVSRYLARRA